VREYQVEHRAPWPGDAGGAVRAVCPGAAVHQEGAAPRPKQPLVRPQQPRRLALPHRSIQPVIICGWSRSMDWPRRPDLGQLGNASVGLIRRPVALGSVTILSMSEMTIAQRRRPQFTNRDQGRNCTGYRRLGVHPTPDRGSRVNGRPGFDSRDLGEPGGYRPPSGSWPAFDQCVASVRIAVQDDVDGVAPFTLIHPHHAGAAPVILDR